jgi:hypothetical protein
MLSSAAKLLPWSRIEEVATRAAEEAPRVEAGVVAQVAATPVEAKAKVLGICPKWPQQRSQVSSLTTLMALFSLGPMSHGRIFPGRIRLNSLPVALPPSPNVRLGL